MTIYYVTRKVLAKLYSSDPRVSKFKNLEPDALQLKENGDYRELFAVKLPD